MCQTADPVANGQLVHRYAAVECRGTHREFRVPGKLPEGHFLAATNLPPGQIPTVKALYDKLAHRHRELERRALANSIELLDNALDQQIGPVSTIRQ
jgi:hypothetical protein